MQLFLIFFTQTATSGINVPSCASLSSATSGIDMPSCTSQSSVTGGINMPSCAGGRPKRKGHRDVEHMIELQQQTLAGIQQLVSILQHLLEVKKMKLELQQEQVHVRSSAVFTREVDGDIHHVVGHFHTLPQLVISSVDVDNILSSLNSQVENFNTRGSGFIIERVSQFVLIITKYRPLHGRSSTCCSCY